MSRRPTRLEQPLPGPRCPACWLSLELPPGQVDICPRCFVFVACLAPARMQRLAPADLTRLSIPDRRALSIRQAHLITVASNAWRSRPWLAQQPSR